VKIAILLSGHLRTWLQCKQNFIDTLCDSNHEIDVFVNTYDRVCRSDYNYFGEADVKDYVNYEILDEWMSGINVVKAVISPEDAPSEPAGGHIKQGNHMIKTFQLFEQFADSTTPYDLIVKSRFDIRLDRKLDYDAILQAVSNDANNLIFISRGGTNGGAPNDLFAVSKHRQMALYMNRFELMLSCCHESMRRLQQPPHLVQYVEIVQTELVRPNGIIQH